MEEKHYLCDCTGEQAGVAINTTSLKKGSLECPFGGPGKLHRSIKNSLLKACPSPLAGTWELVLRWVDRPPACPALTDRSTHHHAHCPSVPRGEVITVPVLPADHGAPCVCSRGCPRLGGARERVQDEERAMPTQHPQAHQCPQGPSGRLPSL